MASLAHEFEEAATDPDLNAWYDNAATRTPTSAPGRSARPTRGNGTVYNMTIGGRDYLIQQNWKLASTQLCALK